MAKRKQYTDEQLIEAVFNSTSYTEVVKKLNLKSHSNIKNQIEKLNLDISHFNIKSWTKEEFRLAVNASASIREALIKLNLVGTGGNYKIFHKYCDLYNVHIVTNTKILYKYKKGECKKIRNSATDSKIINAIKANISYASALCDLKLNDYTSNRKWIKNKISELKLDISHFLGQGHSKGKVLNSKIKTPLSEILIERSYYSTSTLSKRLVKEGIFEYKCVGCGINAWKTIIDNCQDTKISLHLDHINGINTDHRLENLRLLCPNCHSKTSTYGSKNKKKMEKTIISIANENVEIEQKIIKQNNFCIDCEVSISINSTRCKPCNGNYKLNKKTKIDWPSTSEIIELVTEFGYCEISRRLGVSDNAIRQRIKRNPGYKKS